MKNFLTIFVWSLLVSPLLAQAPATIPHAIKLPKEKLQPFLEQHCIRCHGPKKQKGQVRFDRDNWVIDNNDTAQRWQDVLDQLNSGDMPPEEEDQPSNKDLTAILETLTGSVLEARRRLTDHGGEIQMRRLNKREYNNTIREIFGFEVNLNDIPEDGEIVTFDTVGTEQFFSSAHFETYLELGRKIANTSLNLNTKSYRKPKTRRVEPEQHVTNKMRKDLAVKDRQKAMSKTGKTWQEMGFKDEGEMKVLFKQWKARAEVPRRYLQYPLVDKGVYICNIAKWVQVNQHVDYRGEYVVKVHGGVVGDPHPLRKHIRVWGDKIHGTLRMKGTPEKPETVSLRIRKPLGNMRLLARVRENQPDNTFQNMKPYINKLGGKGDRIDSRAAIWLDWLEIEGPFYPKRRPAFEEMLYPNKPTGGASQLFGRDKDARAFIENFTSLAFRRKKADVSYLNALHDKFKAHRAAGMDYKKAMAEVMAVVLSSPSFLFINEAVPAQAKAHAPLSNRELAIRLSYYIWGSPPDAALYAANLSDPKQYAAQVDRLLSDSRSSRLVQGFMSQWAEFDRLDAITVDRREHIFFNEGVQQDAKKEVLTFFETLMRENLPVKNLIDSDFVTVNSALATHYGMNEDMIDASGFHKVKLPADSTRGGLLTQAAFLTTGSNGERSSPVIRGALVMEKILHDKPAPPPPNVPELDEASSKPMTNKQLVLLHQKRAACASCHKKMDVIGFGLENFDPIGRWRTSEKVGRKSVLIDPSGKLPNGGAFTTVEELKKLLVKHDDQLARELCSSLLSYGLGRTIEFSDRDDIDAILAKVKAKKYRTRDLVREVALSAVFKKR